MPAIEVRDLVRRRRGIEAVRGISFSVERGEIFGLLGPNGAGKTSSIEVLEGLERPDEGSVQVLGLALPAEASQVKERIGVQLQVTGLPRYLTVSETIDLFGSFYRRRVLKTEHLIERLGLDPVTRRLTSRLSGGERQRVALALALVNDPEILFLDEPSAGLDPHARRELWAIIREWRSEGKTVFLTTHDMHEAEALCDRVAIMNEGTIVASGLVRTLVASATEQAIWVEADGVQLGEGFETVSAVSRVLRDEDGVLIYSTNAMETMASLLDLRARGELQFASLQLRTASLEDVFLRTTGRRLES